MKRTILSAVSAVALLTTAAYAEVPATQNDSGAYVVINGGLSKSSKAKFNDSVNNFSSSLKSKNKAVFGAGVGFRFNDNFRTDLVLNFRNFGADKVSNNFTNATTGATSSYNLNSKFKTVNPMLTAYYDIADLGMFTPYVGAGVGLSFYNAKTTLQLDNHAPTTAVAVSDKRKNKKATFTYQATVGTAVNFSDNVALDVAYKYVNAGKYHVTVSALKGSYKKNLRAHEVTAGLRFSF